jgi:valyl-tRNA synthetase
MAEFPKKYKHIEIEKKWQSYWLTENIYKWDKSAKREDSYVIDTPPPTVSGLLHMGHIFSYTQADIIARYQRMKGLNVFYPMGFDDNGLPTERLVEKVKKVRGVHLPREEFTKLCKEVVKDSEEEFRELFKSIALSVDWSQEYQTISDNSKSISQRSFIDLFEKNHIYRQEEPVLWDPIDRTALSQADIEDITYDSFMNYIKFNVEGQDLIIATTRPELLPACSAIFVHPDDARYKNLIGKKASSPIFGIKVTIFADENVNIEKGSGAVMCCTFGDSTDVIWWKLFKLDTKIILDKFGKILPAEEISFFKEFSHLGQETYNKITGLKVTEARKQIIEELQAQDLLVKQDPITQSVKCAERSKSPIEILITPQWFVRVLDKKAELLEKANECNWHPEYMKERLVNWINGLSWDWCISRQRFFGVPIPVWYSKREGEEGKVIIPSLADLPIDPSQTLPQGYTADEVIADFDVMDTWATSSVSPQLNSLAINDDNYIDLERHKSLFPADLRPQAHEIIRTWAFTTIVKSHLHENSIPWKNLMISGWCLAADKTKMSKSKGNVVTPQQLIINKGADVIRYWTANSKLGADIAYSEEMLSNGDRLQNKLWNAAKFVSLHIANKQQDIANISLAIKEKIIFEIADIWLLSKLEKTIIKVTENFEKYEYAAARLAIEQFFWKDFCDNYLEISKTRAYNAQNNNEIGQQSAIHTMYFALKNILIMLAPIMPHITEEIYQLIYQDNKSIHQQGIWPKIDLGLNQELIKIGEEIVAILDIVKQFKAEKQISIKAPIEFIKIVNHGLKTELLINAIDDLKDVTSTNNILLNQDEDDSYIKTATQNTSIKIFL